LFFDFTYKADIFSLDAFSEFNAGGMLQSVTLPYYWSAQASVCWQLTFADGKVCLIAP